MELIMYLQEEGYEVSIWDYDVEFVMYVEKDDEVATLGVSEEDLIKMVRNIAASSKRLGKEMMQAIIEEM